MKINYVLGDQTHTKQNKIIQVGQSMIPVPRPVMTDAEEAMMRCIVEQSGYFERSKTRDLDTELLREIIRLHLLPPNFPLTRITSAGWWPSRSLSALKVVRSSSLCSVGGLPSLLRLSQFCSICQSLTGVR